MRNIFSCFLTIQFFFYLFGSIKTKSNLIKDACKNVVFDVNKHRHKQMISVSPGGYKGVYMLGTSIFLKENYDLSEYIFSGASAGAWNALFLTCNKNINIFLKILVLTAIEKSENIYDFEKQLKKDLLENLDSDDFDLDRLFIGVTTFSCFHWKTLIYSNFCNLEDAIDCCIASSHIPFLGGSLLNVYKDIFSFDGGFSSYPYIELPNNILHITPSMWKNKVHSFSSCNLLFKDKNNFNNMLMEGYSDAVRHKAFLDTILL